MGHECVASAPETAEPSACRRPPGGPDQLQHPLHINTYVNDVSVSAIRNMLTYVFSLGLQAMRPLLYMDRPRTIAYTPGADTMITQVLTSRMNCMQDSIQNIGNTPEGARSHASQ
jgi:hypothetical protein